MFCSISGTVPEQAVVSVKSGHLFEKSLIDKYVRETGKCPVTGEPLALDELLPLKINKTVKPRTAPATSIPGLLSLFHDEWDANMLELHNTRTQLHQTRQELSHALYQHDAATRVIARLLKERDEARAVLSDMKQQYAAELAAAQTAARAAAEAKAEAEGGRRPKAGIPDDILADLAEVNSTLSKGRKKRPLPDSLATAEDLASLALSGSFPLHKTTAGGIVALDVNPQQQGIVVTAGADASVQLFDYLQGRTLASLEGHSKRCTGVAYLLADLLVSSSADKTARVWRGGDGGSDSSWQCAAVLRDHTAEVVGVTAHPSRRYFVTASADASWAFYDVESLTCLRQLGADEGPGEPYTCLQFHPDGLILGTGTEGKAIRIWEVKQQKAVAACEGHAGAIRCLAFSENGYHLASVSDDCVKLWDLRKLQNFKTLEPFTDGPCASVAFDHSGQYLAVGGPAVKIYGQKQQWSELRTLSEVPKRAAVLRWGPDARSLLVGAADHNLRLFAIPT
ncbi:U-box domain-containing protein 72 [Tetrabaena socialis]|uniref:Pre-mRNA-processing factor 19 n=1 Tax=Tetrabaena socialis TaxID=47790 RepID=A0A2J8A4A1_9CHLO|nr:U-box domain-containing protein 72 [Tetrabaena socialis]|eukprot:PNH07333.1 U-box domain-containing protein 72 [Tetrabaena socialis]